MKTNRKNRSILFRGLMLVLAFALMIVYMPLANVMSLVRAATNYTDYNYVTIGTAAKGVTTSVTKGATYKISEAYIGGNTAYVVGGDIDGIEINAADHVTLKSSNVSVKYSAKTIGSITDGVAADGVTLSVDAGYIGEFTAEKLGSYTITYAYEYYFNGETDNTITNVYELVVTSTLSKAEINFEDNSDVILPSIIDLKQAKIGENTYKDMYLPIPKVVGEDEKEAEFTAVVARADVLSAGNFLLVSVKDAEGNAVSVTKEADKLFVGGDVFNTTGAGKYTITYSYYENGNFIVSTQKVVNAKDEYYKKYDLKFEIGSAWQNNGETGVEKELPTAKGITSADTTPASEAVDVYYSVKVQFKAAGETYQDLDATLYADVLNEDGTLKDPTAFKPLEDGSYTFIYSIYDYYYDSENPSDKHTASTAKGRYEWTDVKDNTAPTPVVYDASTYNEEEGFVDARDLIPSKALKGSVIVYAIGMTDNVSKVGDEKVVLQRKVMTDSSTVKLTIEDYNDKNLIFNYTTASELRTNHYTLAKLILDGSSNTDAIATLKSNGYMVVVDKANYEALYNTLNDENYFDAIESVEDKATALAWFKTEDAKDAGFAYIDTNETFGTQTGTYTIYYTAKDAAGNEANVHPSINLRSTFTDLEAPTIEVATTFANKYEPTDVVKFDAPVVSDKQIDLNSKTRTFYRFLNNLDEPIAVEGFTADLDDVWADLAAEDATKYAAYEGEEYFEIKDGKFEIDLAQAEDAEKVQLFIYAYDDVGNVGIYARTLEIETIEDSYLPALGQITNDNTGVEYLRGAEVELPTLMVADDVASYLTYDVKVVYEGDEEVGVENTSATKTNYTMKVNAGSFTASFAGKYQARIAVKDYENRMIVVFANYTAKNGQLVGTIGEVNTTLASTSVNVGEEVELPEATITNTLEDSVTYDDRAGSTAQYIIRGITKDGKVEGRYQIEGSTPNGNKFIPTAAGSYKVKYVAQIEVYNKDLFEYVEEAWNALANDVTGGYYQAGSVEFVVEDGAFVIGDHTIAKVDGKIVVDETYYYTNDAGIQYKKLADDTNVEANVVFADNADLRTIEFDVWFREFKAYTKESSVVTITATAKSTTAANQSLYDYSDVKEMSAADFRANGLTIYGIEGLDANAEGYYYRADWTLADGTNGTLNKREGEQALEDYVLKMSDLNGAENPDGIYTIKYYSAANTLQAEYTITIGDNQEPEVKTAENFVGTSFEIGDRVIIDTTKITFSDNVELPEGTEPTIKLVNTSTGAEVHYEKSGTKYIFDKFDKEGSIGTYKLTIEVKDKVGNVGSKTIDFEVTAKSRNATNAYKAVGIVLIVVSVLVLVGVVVYFIVSKVKLDKELKK